MLTWRTRIERLVHQTIGFSTFLSMHAGVIGLFIHRDEFA
ncbi:MAG TPA: IS1 family transposase [Candidatus Competibacteraceae bacterium]|nr:IS1 family transposase [Candidatus Competibacteraceae bacterium]